MRSAGVNCRDDHCSEETHSGVENDGALVAAGTVIVAVTAVPDRDQ